MIPVISEIGDDFLPELKLSVPIIFEEKETVIDLRLLAQFLDQFDLSFLRSEKICCTSDVFMPGSKSSNSGS